MTDMDIQTLVKLNVGRTEHTGDRPMDIQTLDVGHTVQLNVGQNIQVTDRWIYR